MKTYVVGGAVRDELLGLPVQDRDYVVVGATPEEMVEKGFRPVGKDFPVFLHPRTQEEYALARTERKSGRGYKGFTVHASPEVTLEEDLRRRDLTINAMAKDPETGALVDPFHGKRDLEQGVLRHVSEAFAEDPVRILRVARFAARFGFAIAPETLALMRRMVSEGEADYLVAERVWQEFAKGLMEPHPEKMFDVLEASGFLGKNLPEIVFRPQAFSGSLPVRFGLLAWSQPESQVEALLSRLRAPNEVREMALLASRNGRLVEIARSPDQLLEVLKRTDAFRRPERFREFLGLAAQRSTTDTARLEQALALTAAVDAGAIAKESPPAEVPARIDAARLAALRKLDG